MTVDLAAWLLADDGPIAEDERVARAANPAPWRRITDKAHLDPNTIFGADRPGGLEKLRNVAQIDLSWERDANAAHIVRWDPARVLAECAAKRAIVEMFVDADDDAWDAAWMAMRALAQPYAGRPGWRDEWTLG